VLVYECLCVTTADSSTGAAAAVNGQVPSTVCGAEHHAELWTELDVTSKFALCYYTDKSLLCQLVGRGAVLAVSTVQLRYMQLNTCCTCCLYICIYQYLILMYSKLCVGSTSDYSVSIHALSVCQLSVRIAQTQY
jgi:hypothetical protein